MTPTARSRVGQIWRWSPNSLCIVVGSGNGGEIRSCRPAGHQGRPAASPGAGSRMRAHARPGAAPDTSRRVSCRRCWQRPRRVAPPDGIQHRAHGQAGALFRELEPLPVRSPARTDRARASSSATSVSPSAIRQGALTLGCPVRGRSCASVAPMAACISLGPARDRISARSRPYRAASQVRSAGGRRSSVGNAPALVMICSISRGVTPASFAAVVGLCNRRAGSASLRTVSPAAIGQVSTMPSRNSVRNGSKSASVRSSSRAS